MTLQHIEQLTNAYASQRDVLAARVQALHDEIEAAKRKALPAIRQAVGQAADARNKLQAAIQDNPRLFVKPKSAIFSGVQVGYRKKKGKIVIDDDEAVITRIRRELPEDQAELLIRVTESVDKNAVGTLAVSDLKRLGIRVTADGDEPFIKPVDSDVDKLVNALLADIEREQINDEAGA